jgi:hypothetical protein
MFRTLALSLGPIDTVGGPTVFSYHPMQLARFLEEVWIARQAATPPPEPTQLEVPAGLRGIEATSGIPVPVQPGWDHLIYAYMIEQTRCYEIFRRVIEEFAYGERLGTPTDATQRWLRTTEQLFFSEEAPHHIYRLASWLRPDSRATRRNAYFRMFGMDLNHGTDDNRPYPYPRPAAANTQFVPTLEDLLREVWRGVENFTNTSGPKPVDNAAIANLALRVYDMLRVRREGGNLARDELWHVSVMSWFHLTVDFDSPIVLDLEAQASAPEERLLKIGERVGLPAHSRSEAYFRLALNLSFILQLIEAASFNSPNTAVALYQPSPPAPPPPLVYDAMLAIIRDWSIATGRDMKARQVAVTPAAPPYPVRPATQAVIPVAPTTAMAPSTNGRARMASEVQPGEMQPGEMQPA